MKKIFVWVLALTTLAGAIGLTLARLSTITYHSDQSMKEGRFWNGRQTFRVDPKTNVIPVQLPGPLDGWGGGEQKEIVLGTKQTGKQRLTITFLDSHEAAPPVIQVTARGKELGRFRVKAGSGKAHAHWAASGVRSEFSVAIPAELLDDDGAGITIRTVEGSWAAIKQITLQRYIPGWVKILTLLGVIALLAMFIWRATSKRLWGRYAGNLALTLFSILITIIFIELVMRNFFPQQEFISSFRPVYMADDDVGFMLKPNVKARLGNDTNRFGMRDYDRYTKHKPDGTFRILVLGDSFTFSLTTMEDSYPKYMERMFAGSAMPVEVLNSGVPSYGTDEEYHYLKKFGLGFEPDLVVLGFFVGNDITDNSIHPAHTAIDGILVRQDTAKKLTRKEITWEKRKKLWLNKSHLYRLLYARNYSALFKNLQEDAVNVRKKMNVEHGGCIKDLGRKIHMSPDRYEGVIRESWEKTKGYLDKITELAGRNNVPIAIVLIPDAVQQNTAEAQELRQRFADTNQWEYPQKALMEYAYEKDWYMLNALPQMMEKAGDERLFYCRDTHFNEIGNRILAEVVNAWLVEENLTPEGVATK